MPEYKHRERTQATVSRQNKRKQTEYRLAERTREIVSRRGKRKQPQNNHTENTRETSIKTDKRQQSMPSNLDALIDHFHKKVSEGPVYVCTSYNSCILNTVLSFCQIYTEMSKTVIWQL